MYANVQYFYGFMITMNGFMNILEHLSRATQVLCTWISEILLLLPIHCFQSAIFTKPHNIDCFTVNEYMLSH